jgi:hypothetical protein
MNRDCKTLNLDECRTRPDCSTRKKTKSEELTCVKKAVRAPKLEAAPALVRKTSIVPKAPRMTAAHKAELRDARPKLAFGKNGSLCLGMTETDCGKAKTACNWIKESADGKRKAHCGMRTHGTKYESMDALSAFNSKKYEEEPRELTPEEIKQARWAKAAASANSVPRSALPFGKDSLCVGMKETDCVKSKPCQWTKQSKDGKRKAHCGRRIEDKSTVFKGVGTKVGGESDPVLRLFYGY